MDERVKEYLKQKYADQLENINTAQAFANLGDVISGQRVGSQVPFFERQKQLAGAQTLGEIERQDEMDLRRQMAQENLDFKRMQLEQAAEQARNNAEMRKAFVHSAETQKQIEQQKGKQLPIAPLEALGDAKASLNALDNALNSFQANQDIAGPQQSLLTKAQKLGEFGKTGQQAKSFDAELQLNAQTIGKYLEGGKMTDADIERYKSMLPNLSDSYEVAKKKTQLIKNLISGKQKSQLEALGQAGYDVSKLNIQPSGINPNIPQKRERKIYQGKIYELVGQDRKNPSSWKVVGE